MKTEWTRWILKREHLEWLVAGVVGLVIFGAKARLIVNYASKVPQADQWDMESDLLYAAWREGVFTWSSLLTPINEHRIVFTQLTNLGLFVVNGCWDPMVQMLAGAVMLAGLLAIIAAWGMARVRRERRGWVVVLVTMAGVVPLSWENTLWGFQSQFCWMLLLAWGALWGWAAEGTPKRRLVGTLCLLAGPFTLSSGVLAAPAVVAVRVCGALGRKRWNGTDWLALVAAGATVGISALFWRHVPQHDGLRAENWGSFSWVMLRLLAWPWPSVVWVSAAVWLPWVILVFLVATGRRAVTARSMIVVGLGGWALVQIVAVAWARGSFMMRGDIASKYLELVWVGVIANGLALLGFGFERTARAARWHSMVAAGWFTVVGTGVGFLTWITVEHVLPEHREALARQETRMKAFLSTDDYGFIAGMKYPAIAYPDSERLAKMARRAREAGILPSELREAEPQWRDASGMVAINYHEFNLGLEAFELRSPPGRRGPWSWVSPAFGQEGGVWLLRTYADTDGGLVRFEVVEVSEGSDSGRVVAVHIPSFLQWDQWSVKLQPGRYHLHIVDERERGMVALIAPRKWGPLSAKAGWVFENALGLTMVSAVGLAMLLGAQSPRSGRR